MNITDTLQSIENNEFTKVFSELYGSDGFFCGRLGVHRLFRYGAAKG